MRSSEWDLDSNDAYGFLSEFQFEMDEEWEREEREREKNFAEYNPFPLVINVAIKNKARQGIPMTLRRKAWLVASGGYEKLQKFGNVYEAACNVVERQKDTLKFTDENIFGGSYPLIDLLPESIVPTIRHFLTVVWTNNRGVQYSPLMPTVSIILLLFLEPALAYLAIQAMINKSQEESWYFTIGRSQYENSAVAIEKLASKKVGDVVRHAESLGLNMTYMTLALMPAFFLPFMPIPVALTVFDSYIIEGRKILVRFILTLFARRRAGLLGARSAKEFIGVIIEELEGLSEIGEMKRFIAESFKIYLSRKPHMVELEREAERGHGRPAGVGAAVSGGAEVMRALIKSRSEPEFSNPLSFPRSKGVPFVEEMLKAGTAEEMVARQAELQMEIMRKALPHVRGGNLLSEKTLYGISNLIPSLYRRHSAELVFQLSRDGTSLRALTQSARARVPYILMVRTARGEVGAFLSDPPNPLVARGGRGWFGGPSTFVFDARDGVVGYKLASPPNRYFINVDRDIISVGGPKPALLISRAFSLLHCEDCETFASPRMTEPEGERILDVELFQLTLSFSSFSSSHSPHQSPSTPSTPTHRHWNTRNEESEDTE